MANEKISNKKTYIKLVDFLPTKNDSFPWQSLPLYIQKKEVFSYSSLQGLSLQDLSNLELVNKEFRGYAENNFLWKKIAENTFSVLDKIFLFLREYIEETSSSKLKSMEFENKAELDNALDEIDKFFTRQEKNEIQKIKKENEGKLYHHNSIPLLKKILFDVQQRIPLFELLNNPFIFRARVSLGIMWFFNGHPNYRKTFYNKLTEIKNILEKTKTLDLNNLPVKMKELYFNTLVHFGLLSPGFSTQEIEAFEKQLRKKKESFKFSVVALIPESIFNKTGFFKEEIKEIKEIKKLEENLTAAKKIKQEILSSTANTLFASPKQLETKPVVTSLTKQEEKKPSL